jgi:D-alanine-D-alanine ligase
MSSKKTTVGIIFGGMSAEHEVSIESAKAIYSNIDQHIFSPLPIYISRQGKWCRMNSRDLLEAESYSDSGRFQKRIESEYRLNSFLPWENHDNDSFDCDIFFPILHGPNGEDGKIQGLLEMSKKPFVGANSVSSALAMNKVVAKTLFTRAGLKTPDFLYFNTNDTGLIKNRIDETLTFPVFIKPNSLGSSIGISKVNDENQLRPALASAFAHDRVIIIEKALKAREIEVSVMGNREIMISTPGELIPHNEFYDYNDKYIDNKTAFKIPAPLDPEINRKIRKMSEKAYRALWLNGMSRIDFFLESGSNDIFINEINTIPGFTEISMFPKLWQTDGISFTELITRLIEFGFAFHRDREKPITG